MKIEVETKMHQITFQTETETFILKTRSKITMKTTLNKLRHASKAYKSFFIYTSYKLGP